MESLCEKYQMSFLQIKSWYDGYVLSLNENVYNPVSIVKAMYNGECGPYWTRTETYEALSLYLDLDIEGLKSDVTAMLEGKTMEVVNCKFVYNRELFISKDHVLIMLVHLGYLTYDAENHTVCIPNEEIRQEFIRAIKYRQN